MALIFRILDVKEMVFFSRKLKAAAIRSVNICQTSEVYHGFQFSSKNLISPLTSEEPQGKIQGEPELVTVQFRLPSLDMAPSNSCMRCPLGTVFLTP